MATNKHATIRYHALDRCFSNSGRRYYIDDLVEVCNNALYDFTGISDGVKRRQVFDDIKFMESEQGWSIPLERCKDGKKVYYRYSERNYSIRNLPVNESEAKQLRETLDILTRFKGMPQFEWMEELVVRIESAFKLKGSGKTIVGFEQNPYLKGLNYFTDLFNAIFYERVLRIEYRGYKQEKPVVMIIHPYFLKQFNSRWFLFGYNDDYNKISNLALDRILSVAEIGSNFIQNEHIDFEEYFEDVLGVSVDEDVLPQTVTLEIDKELWPYIESKPIHGSQKVISKQVKTVTIELNVQINYELTSLLFSYGDGLKVTAPDLLVENIKGKVLKMKYKYS